VPDGGAPQVEQEGILCNFFVTEITSKEKNLRQWK
jgi:hypothetical protein